jgi:arylsulfatase
MRTTKPTKGSVQALFVFALLFIVQQINAQQEQSYQGKIGKTLTDSKEWWPEAVKPPSGSPNVIWILLDDVGFGASSTFGGLIKTPTFDSLAANGLRYTNFHTCAICAPTRAALLTGRNSASVHMSGFAHTILSAGFPGWDGKIPSADGTVAEILRDNGYNTFAVGKYGVTPDEDATDAGPFDRWPSGKGFEHFFGFLGSQTDQYKPDLVEDNAHVATDGRNLMNKLQTKQFLTLIVKRKLHPTNLSSYTTHQAPYMHHTRFLHNGWICIKGNLTKAGMPTGSRF